MSERLERLEFPNTPIEQKLGKDLAQFHYTDEPEHPDLWIHDETIEAIPLYGKQATVNAYLWKTGHCNEIVLPEIDVENKLLKFNSISDEDEITIFGNHYEIRRFVYGDNYEWDLYP